MSKYPVGSTWKVTDPKTGMIGKIWLKEKDGQFEVWYWSSCFSDGSNYRFDGEDHIGP